jgi:predicted nucleic acid-binding protein
MTDQRPRWDSDVIIARIQRTKGRIHRLEPITESAERGDTTIIVSALAMVEVVKLKDLGLLDPQTEQLVTDFFENPYVAVRNVDRFVAEKARPIVRAFNLKPTDAIQIATAILMKSDVLHTFDANHLLRLNGKVDGLRIEEPPEP